MIKEIKKTHLPVGRNIPRDVFLHLLAVVTLYWSSVTFVGILWQCINKFLPDVLDYSYMGNTELIRFFVASLIIVFPIFILISWYLNKIYAKEAVVRESKIRKWLIYFTLFVAALVIIVDLVTVINTFLGGEIKARFILKSLSVLVVAGIIFWYYLDDVRRETPTKLAKYFAWVTSILVLAAIITGFFIVGSPTTARLVELDQRKISDLQSIQYQVVNYWQAKEKLPATLNDLNDPISSFKIPLDPQNEEKGYIYEYNIKDATNLIFELCATFNKEGADQYNQTRPISVAFPGKIGDSWYHSIGRVCFARTIDKDKYPPLSKTK